jgi:glucose-1-phosphate thymidylyltransferase
MKKGACIFGYYVTDPERYGVVEFDKNNKVLSIEEKPLQPRSNYAVTGLYFYDNTVVNKAKSLKPSPRGELEITDLNKVYLEEGTLDIRLMGRGMAWLDTGTYESLLQAANFIATLEQRQGLKASCIEEIAYKRGFINKNQLLKLAQPIKNSQYGKYLLRIAGEEVYIFEGLK